MSKVTRRGGFSDRNSIKPENREIQIKKFDDRTKTQLRNKIIEMYRNIIKWNSEEEQEFFRYVLGEIYSEKISSSHLYSENNIFLTIDGTFENEDYDDILTLIEAVIQYFENLTQYNSRYKKDYFFKQMNSVFERKYVGYRFINGEISPISDEFEIRAINEAIDNIHENVKIHISNANSLLSNRENPDYENSIKESITAVEAMAEIITGENGKSASLGNMLKKLKDSGIYIHKALEEAFNKLYGYTSDASGIRHAGEIGGPNSTFDEAKYMLVACSAFVNYLMGISAN